MKRCCVIVDNAYLYEEVNRIIQRQGLYENIEFRFFCSGKDGKPGAEDDSKKGHLEYITLENVSPLFYKGFDVLLSLHCKQLFPEAIIKENRCINVHPGYNPYNRGWYPQVFSIINKKPVGVTIHEMDTQIDHGPVIVRELVEIADSDTSYDVYQKILKKECELLDKYLAALVEGNYKKQVIEAEGNINYRKDFKKLCEIDRKQIATYGEVIDFLRAMTFGNYNNAYFIDTKGNKTYVRIILEQSGNKALD